MRFLYSDSGGLEQPMLPTQPPTTNPVAPASKRKNVNDAGLLGNVPKKPRTDDNVPERNLAKRVEKKGNFVITRKTSVAPQSFQGTGNDIQRAPSRATTSETQTTSFDTGPSRSQARTKPPSVVSTAGTTFARVRKKGKERDVPASTAGENEVEEDVRQMNSEADDLRDRSRASIASMTPAAMTVELEFPPSKSAAVNAGNSRVTQLRQQFDGGGTTTPTRPGRDGVMPIADQETPQIARNRAFRGESRPPTESSAGQTQSPVKPSNGGPSGLTRRRSSLSMRGKRVSSTFESTGIITMPHTSVSDTSLYKHIDPELPESQRVRQLLIWVASRAKGLPSSSRGGKRKANEKQAPDLNLPQLPPGGLELLQEVEDDVIRQLAEKKIDTSAYSGPPGVNGLWKLKENEQNVKNRKREKLFTEQIEERKKEDLAWAEVAQFYNAHQANVLSAINQKNRASSKGKGKQRAASQEPEDLEPWENELSEAFRGPKGYDVAKQLIDLGVDGAGRGDPRLEQLQYKEGRLHAALSVARQLTHVARHDLDRRFALLNISLAQRTLPSTSSAMTGQQTLSNVIPATALPASRHAGPDAQDLLRALTRTDAARPKREVGDAARRAAKDVARARESQAHQSAEGGVVMVQERKLTDVPPPTPRNPPGTPKRAGTPGASRR